MSLSATGILVMLFGLSFTTYDCVVMVRIASLHAFKEKCDANREKCEETDVCSKCHENARCIYINSHYECRCANGYTGNGLSCTDFDECSELGDKNVRCVNTAGSYELHCETGQVLAANRRSCIPEPCQNITCKEPMTRCVNDEHDPKVHHCRCPLNTIGEKCQFPGPCLPSVTSCMNGKCVQVNDVGKYRCDCKPGYVGYFCEFDDPCRSNPCHHDGKCNPDNNTGKCTCDCRKTGFFGPTCNDTDKCTSSPCKNGGFCTTDSTGNILCICKHGFTGGLCQTAVTTCTDKTCNEGKCEEDNGKVNCFCGKKHTGEYCEIDVTCDDHPCENGGVCKDGNGSYTCSCGAGYSGSNCEIIELPCEQDIFTNLEDKCVAKNPCGQSQMCWTDEDGNATCFCQSGFSGDDCLSKVSSCEDVVCLHDGKCISEDGKFKCNCSAEYGGSNCQNKANGEILLPPEMSYFCPVVQTIGERAGCKKCSAGVVNCKGCCSREEQSCEANCHQMDQFCKSCADGTVNYEQCKEVKTKCEDSSLVKCTSSCSTEAENCRNSCADTGNGAEECPKVYSCPKAKEQRTRHKGYISGVQCRALKYPSGKIECAYKNVTAKKEEYQSYIMFPRINFAGKLQIDSATLNNVFSNFDIKTFAPADTKITEENWNPMGSSDFRLVDVSVTRICHAENLCFYQPHEDPLAGAPIKDQANGKVSAKIVDLDIEVQGRLSEIYGLSIDIGGYFKGDMERASFQSLWYKMIDVPNDDYGQGSRLQSVLNNVQFSMKKDDSSIVQHLRENIGPNQKLSICFNVDLMGEHPAANYSYARIVGSIGLAGEKAPYFFDHGRLLRHLQATAELNYAPFTVDEHKKKIYIDLGNTLAIDRHGDVLVAVGQLALGVYAGEEADGVETPNCLDKITWISRIYYNEYGGYHFTAGINKVDIPRHLKGSLDKQFVLAKINEDGSCLKIFLAEHKKGINVRSNSRFIFRAEYEEIVQGSLFVTIFGKKPKPAQDINLKLETADSIIRDHPLGPKQPFGLFKDNEDASIYHYYFYAMNNPDNIRKIIDGQVYALQYTFDGYPLNPDRNEAMNTAICIHVYDKFVVNDRPKWLLNILPIFQLYANLYPVMRSFLDLADYNSVVKKKCHIITAMSLDFQDPQFMPVTRDLSSGKTKMVLKWLDLDKPEFGFTHAEQLTIQHLIDLLQTALQLEHSTIPVYLNGFLSIKPFQNQEVKEMIHQIIVDEMFHFAQVANIINGLGGRPYLLGKTFVPAFPSHLPGGCRPDMIASINKISNQQINNVYMEIEEPSYVLKDHELVALINKISKANLQSLNDSGDGGDDYQGQCAEALGFFPLPNRKVTEKNHETIGDLYMAVVYILGQLSICGQKDIFTGKTRQLKWSNPKILREVGSYKDALEAIKAIVDQGEGASPYNPLQQNVDSSELSHYFKFSSIYHGRHITTFNVTNEKVYDNNEEECHENYVYLGDKIPFFETGVWPVVKDPQMSKYKPDSQAYKNAQAFNDIYRRLLETLQSVFDGNVDRFDDTFGLMKSLIVYGSRVVQTPIDEDGDPNIGPNAGPTYFN